MYRIYIDLCFTKSERPFVYLVCSKVKGKKIELHEGDKSLVTFTVQFIESLCDKDEWEKIRQWLK